MSIKRRRLQTCSTWYDPQCFVCGYICENLWFLILKLNEGDHSDPSTRNESDEENQVVIPTGAKAKKKIKKKRRQQVVDTENVDLEEEFLLATPPNPSVCTIVKAAPHKNALALDQKCLNPDNELKKIFGSKIVLAGQKKKSRGRTYVKSSWLVAAKANWAQIGKTGMCLLLHTL